ncbi:MAG: proline dehydrogenase family protein [Planctomycetota bacterium]
MLSRVLPASFVRFFARPYVAGASVESALEIASANLGKGLRTTLDLLGESVESDEQVQRSIGTYERLIDRLAEDTRFAEAGRRPSVSLKPSAFSTGSVVASAEPITRLARRASERGVALTIDMEDRRWTDFTLDLTLSLFGEGLDVGTVLQTRLDRTSEDLARLPAGLRVRLVIGIYDEPKEVAVQQKRLMKERMVAYARRGLDDGLFIEFATHDEEFLRRFVADTAPRAPDRCEIQLLLGVPRAGFARDLAAGNLGPALPLRVYVPFAEGWDEATAYLRRRMAESPSMVWLVLRNLFARGH